jgi:putative oxidoreductase
VAGRRVSGGTGEIMNIAGFSPFVVVRLMLGGVFLYAGFTKIADPTTFAGSIAAYRILPYFGNYLVAAVLPWIEALCGLLIITGYRVKAAATLVVILNLAFMAALASTIVRGLDIDCGCFSKTGERTSAWTAIGRDVVLLAMALYTARGKKHPPS